MASKAEGYRPRARNSRKPVNCAPCRIQKLKCNKEKPCSECVLHDTQHLCYTEEGEEYMNRPALPTKFDPLVELRLIRRSVAALEGHYKAERSLGRKTVPSRPGNPIEDAIISNGEGNYYYGPTHPLAPIFHPQSRLPIEIKSPPDSFMCRSLIQVMPSKDVAKTLVHTYLESSTWIFAYVNQKSLQWKLDRYVETGYCDDLTLAMFFAVFSIALHYTPWTAPVLRAFPEPAMVIGDHFHNLCITVLEQSSSAFISSPSVELLEVLLLVGHYTLCAKKPDSGEKLWALRGRLLSLCMSMGLHRDPSAWNMPEQEVTRRRWAFWNILTFERYYSLLLGRPMAISNTHFDVQFPMPDTTTSHDLVENDSQLFYLFSFRFTRILGSILDDLNRLMPLSPERVAHHDQVLAQWINSWPSDLRLDEHSMARSFAGAKDIGIRRRGLQAMHLHGQAHFVRFALHQPSTTSDLTNSFAAWNHDKVAEAAAFLINMYAGSVPNFSTNPNLLVPGHTTAGTFNLFAACVFYCFQLLNRPDHASSRIYRNGLLAAIESFRRLRELPIADRCYKILVAFAPLTNDHLELEDEASRIERILALRRITVPFVGVPEDSDVEDAYPFEAVRALISMPSSSTNSPSTLSSSNTDRADLYGVGVDAGFEGEGIPMSWAGDY